MRMPAFTVERERETERERGKGRAQGRATGVAPSIELVVTLQSLLKRKTSAGGKTDDTIDLGT